MPTPSHDGPDLRVNEGFGIGAAYQPQIAALTGGGFVAVWQGFLGAADDADQGGTVLARIFGADRAPLGPPFAVPTDLTGSQSEFSVIGLPDGGFAVLFGTGPLGGAAGRPILARFDADGTRRGDDTDVPAASALIGTGFAQGHGLALQEIGGEVKLVALIRSVDVGSATGAALVRFGLDGALEAEAALDLRLMSPASASLDALADGGFGVLGLLRSPGSNVWGPFDLVYRRLDAEGATVGDSVLTLSNGHAEAVSGVLADGRIAVAFTSFASDPGRVVLTLVTLSAEGAELSRTVAASRTFAEGGMSLHGIAADDAGGWVVGMSFGVSAELFDTNAVFLPVRSDGSIGEVRQVNRLEEGSQAPMQLAWLEDGSLAAVRADRFVIAATYFDPSGTTGGQAPTGIVVTGAPVPLGAPGAVIGTVQVTDPDETSGWTIQIVGANASRYSLVGNEIRLNSWIQLTEGMTDLNRVTIRVIDKDFNVLQRVIEFPLEVAEDPNAPVIWRGGPGADVKNGGPGDDELRGGGGPDVLRGRGGDDSLWGGAGNDSLHGDAGDDFLWGGGGADKIWGGAGADSIWGGDGGDELWGGDGPDVVYGGGGADKLWGGNGADTLEGGAGGDELRGGGGSDVLRGQGGHDRLFGDDGRDRLFGGDGNDQLFGGKGDDVLFGGKGADLLVGGRGDDVMSGGPGRDVFRFGARDGDNRITDFAPGEDQLQITGGARRFRDLEISREGSDLRVTFGQTEVLLEGVRRAEFGADDVIFG